VLRDEFARDAEFVAAVRNQARALAAAAHALRGVQRVYEYGVTGPASSSWRSSGPRAPPSKSRCGRSAGRGTALPRDRPAGARGTHLSPASSRPDRANRCSWSTTAGIRLVGAEQRPRIARRSGFAARSSRSPIARPNRSAR
jgi:hypothetical protein